MNVPNYFNSDTAKIGAFRFSRNPLKWVFFYQLLAIYSGSGVCITMHPSKNIIYPEIGH